MVTPGPSGRNWRDGLTPAQLSSLKNLRKAARTNQKLSDEMKLINALNLMPAEKLLKPKRRNHAMLEEQGDNMSTIAYPPSTNDGASTIDGDLDTGLEDVTIVEDTGLEDLADMDEDFDLIGLSKKPHTGTDYTKQVVEGPDVPQQLPHPNTWPENVQGIHKAKGIVTYCRSLMEDDEKFPSKLATVEEEEFYTPRAPTVEQSTQINDPWVADVNTDRYPQSGGAAENMVHQNFHRGFPESNEEVIDRVHAESIPYKDQLAKAIITTSANADLIVGRIRMLMGCKNAQSRIW